MNYEDKEHEHIYRKLYEQPTEYCILCNQKKSYEHEELWLSAFIDSLIDANDVDNEQRQAAKKQLAQRLTEVRIDELN